MTKAIKRIVPIVLMRKTTKDERAEEVVPMNKFLRAIRWFIIVVIVGFIAMGIILWYVVGISAENHKLIKEQQQTQQQGHQDRLQEDESLQKQIAAAVCTFVDPVPPGTSPQVDELRQKYGCPFTPTSTAP